MRLPATITIGLANRKKSQGGQNIGDMADNYVIEAEVEVDREAYDDPMDALEYVNDIFNESDDVTGVSATLKEDSSS